MNRKLTVPILAALLFGLGATGCVEQQPSLSMSGHYLGEGAEGSSVCTYTLDFNQTSLTRGFVSLEDLRTNGQQVFPGGLAYAPGTYLFNALYESKLEDSRNVGAESGGGGGGGFSGLNTDMSEIYIEGARVIFPGDLNTFNVDGFGVFTYARELERPLGARVPSGGEVGYQQIPIFDSAAEVRELSNMIGELGVSDDTVLTFIVEIQLYGKTGSGHEVESNKFRWPISICRDCGTTNSTCSAPESDGAPA